MAPGEKQGERIEAAAERAYQAFCASPSRVYLPLQTKTWAELPEVLKQAWRAAAAAILDSQ